MHITNSPLYHISQLLNQEQRSERPNFRIVVFVMPFNSQSLETVVPYLAAIAPTYRLISHDGKPE